MKELLRKGKKLFVVNQFFPPDFAPTGQLINELVAHLGDNGTPIKVFTGLPAYAFNEVSALPLEIHNNVIIRRTRATQVSIHNIRGKSFSRIFIYGSFNSSSSETSKKRRYVTLDNSTAIFTFHWISTSSC